MSKAIAVLNAGSSSVKFSLFRGPDLELVVRGQAESIQTMPRFVAKDPAGATVSTMARRWVSRSFTRAGRLRQSTGERDCASVTSRLRI